MPVTTIRLFRDGSDWCAVWDDFQNMAESICGCGPDPNSAIRELLAATDFHRLQETSQEWKLPLNSLELDTIGAT